MRIQHLFELKIPLLERWIAQNNLLIGKENECSNCISLTSTDGENIKKHNEKAENVVLCPKEMMKNNVETTSGISSEPPVSLTLVLQESEYQTTNSRVTHTHEMNYSNCPEGNSFANQIHQQLPTPIEKCIVLKGDESITRWFRISSFQKQELLKEPINPFLFSVLYSQLIHYSSCPSGCSVGILFVIIVICVIINYFVNKDKS